MQLTAPVLSTRLRAGRAISAQLLGPMDVITKVNSGFTITIHDHKLHMHCKPTLLHEGVNETDKTSTQLTFNFGAGTTSITLKLEL